MTIAASFCCSDGVVLCADSQLTFPEMLKYADSKLRIGKDLRCVPVFVFCGDIDYQKQCSSHFLAALSEAEREGRSLQAALEASALEMHRTYYEAYPNPEDKLQASMFVSVFTGTRRTVHKIWGPKVSVVERMECLGAGMYLAQSLSSTYWEFGNDMKRTALAATYILSDVKRYVDGCGGSSQIICLSNKGDQSMYAQDSLFRVDPIGMIENRYQVWKQRFGALLMDFQDYRMSHLDFEERLSRLSEHLLEIRKERTDYYDDAEFQEIHAQTQALRESEEDAES
jgi:hypothetical protein